MKILLQLLAVFTMTASGFASFGSDKKDVLETNAGNVDMTFIGHASILFQFEGKSIYVDPSNAYATFDQSMPKADIILITHDHYDHLDLKAIAAISKPETEIAAPENCKAAKPKYIMANGDKATIEGIKIEAVPAYNIVHKTDDGHFYHPKGIGNGYIITFGDKKVYVAGDTEDIPEMMKLKNIDVAFLPVNLPYTMDLDMFADAVKEVNAKKVYPYHYTNTNMQQLQEKMKGYKGTEIILKNFY